MKKILSSLLFFNIQASGNTVGKALRKINREDIVKQCIFNVEVVTDDIERAMAKAHFDQSGFDTFKDELGPSRDATLNRDVSLDVSYDEQDMMKVRRNDVFNLMKFIFALEAAVMYITFLYDFVAGGNYYFKAHNTGKF